MPVPFVQKANSGVPSGTATTKAATLSGQTLNNLNIVLVQWGNASGTTTAITASVTDTQGNTYQPASQPTLSPGAGSCIVIQLFYAPQIKAGNNTITATFSAAASYAFIGVYEYGVQLANPLGASTGMASVGPYSATSAQSTGQTYANQGDLVFMAAISNSGPPTPGTGFTSRDSIYTLMTGDQQAAASGPIKATATGNANWAIQVATFMTATSAAVPAASGEFLLNDTFIGSSGTPSSLQGANSWTNWALTAGAHWVQVNAGAQVILTRMRLACLAGAEDMLISATFQGCNDPSFSINPVTITVPGLGTRLLTGTLVNEFVLSPGAAYQYYRLSMTATIPGPNSPLSCLDVYAGWAQGVVGQPADIVLNPSSGAFDLPTYVKLSCLTTSALIYYTLDGSTPTTSSSLYSTPGVLVNSSAPLQAMGVSPGQNGNGRVLSRPVHIGATEVSQDILYDSRSYRIWAMNGHVFQDPVSKYWYRFGSNADTPTYYGTGWNGNLCYRSADLRNWDFRAQIMQVAAGSANGGTTNNIYHIAVHVLYNQANNNYVAWTDDYQGPLASIVWKGKSSWTAPSPEGPFTLVRTLLTFPGIPTTGANDWGQGDFCLLLDTNGTDGYLISTMGNGSTYDSNLFIAKLTADFTNISASTSLQAWVQEGPGIMVIGGTYYLSASGVNGFNASATALLTATAPLGPYTFRQTNICQPYSGGNPPPSDYTTSYGTQHWEILPVPGRTNGYIFYGDVYSFTSNSFPNHRRYRLPATVSGNSISVNWLSAWSFDAQMPTVSGAPAAASGLNVSAGTATWTNHEPNPAKLYVDVSADSGFTTGVASVPVADGASSVSNLPVASYYRVRTLNASGWASSNVFSASSGGGPSSGSPIAPGTTIDALFTTAFGNRSNDLGSSPLYRWSDSGTVQAYWPTVNGPLILVHLEARPNAPSIIQP